MGLEAINFFFRSEKQIELSVASNIEITHNEGKKYVYKKNNDYWIDIEFQDNNSLSIRITLCNPTEPVLVALHNLMSYLFMYDGAILLDLATKQVYKKYDNKVREALEESYLNRKRIFQGMYGDYTAAISSEEFYKRQRR